MSKHSALEQPQHVAYHMLTLLFWPSLQVLLGAVADRELTTLEERAAVSSSVFWLLGQELLCQLGWCGDSLQQRGQGCCCCCCMAPTGALSSCTYQPIQTHVHLCISKV
jgi:hypothetical protein